MVRMQSGEAGKRGVLTYWPVMCGLGTRVNVSAVRAFFGYPLISTTSYLCGICGTLCHKLGSTAFFRLGCILYLECQHNLHSEVSGCHLIDLHHRILAASVFHSYDCLAVLCVGVSR